MYIGREAFTPATNRESARALFARSVERIEVETHSYCNRRCDYCPNAVGDRLGANQRMADDIWHLLLSNLREIDYAANFIFTSYNEPLADKIILQRIREAREYIPRARTMIYTNGDYLKPDYLAELAQAGLDYLHISIHTRPGDKYNDIHALNHIAKLVKRMGTSVHFQSLKPNEFVIAKMPHPSMEIEIRAINYYRHGTDRGGLLDGFNKTPARTLPCHFPFAHFHMGYEGTVVPCCHIRSDAQAHQPYRYGNLRDFGSIFEAYASRVATEWRRHLISFEAKQVPCDTCAAPFMSQDPKALHQIQAAWEQNVRDET
ncbi:MAG: radical SAM protein [Gallionella sp.]|nr:radical SAM protein [Gallionella sp.]